MSSPKRRRGGGRQRKKQQQSRERFDALHVEGTSTSWTLSADSNKRKGVKLSTGSGLEVFRRAAMAAAPHMRDRVEALTQELDRRNVSKGHT